MESMKPEAQRVRAMRSVFRVRLSSIRVCKLRLNQVPVAIATIDHCCHHADIDECVDNNGGCDVNAVCSNIVGSYFCYCKDGYYGHGNNCTGKKTKERNNFIHHITELTNKIDTLAEISIEGCRKAGAIGAGRP